MAKRALVIASSYANYPGVDNDAACMQHVLGARGFEITRCRGLHATRRGIIDAYHQLIATTEKGDAAVVYYTGHGGLVENSQYVPSSGFPLFLQHICPTDFDATIDGDFRGISSLELSLLQAELTTRTENVTIIFECCFSAELSRGEAEQPTPILTRAALAAHLDALRERIAALPIAGNPHAIRIAASGQRELARRDPLPDGAALRAAGIEIEPRDGWIGSLTLALATVLQSIGTARVAWRSIAPELRSRVLFQRPEIEGPTARIPFALDLVDAAAFGARLDGDTAILAAGRLHGVTAGDVYEIRTAASPSTLARITIDRVDPMSSAAHAIEWVAAEHVFPEGALATAKQLAFPRYPLRVEAPPAASDRVRQAIAASTRLRAATDDDVPIARIHITDHELELRDALGPLFPRAPFPDDLDKAIRDVENLATVQRLRELPDDPSILADAVTVELGVAVNGAFVALDQPRLGLADRLAIRLENRTDAAIWAHLFSVGLRGRIAPAGTGPSGTQLLRDQPRIIGDSVAGSLVGFPMSWPAGLPRDQPRVDTALVILTSEPADLSVLETREHLRSASSSLVALFDQLRTGTTRSAAPPTAYALRWRNYLLAPT